ncbi:MAG: coenzyme F420-0:L-glutamate ligase, partial [Nitrososphaerales archaeon]|nr:coenzyme F420-0:L-glutamate ligase [Nitrososphaerales archaeon]
TINDGVLSPNSGIDRSNVYPGYVILHPSDPFKKAEDLRKAIFERTGRKVGIVITDSRLLPTRVGTVGIAIGVAGFEPVRDMRGKKDLFGNVLKVTRQALADDISSGAQLLMGEADEGIPIVIVRAVDLQQNPITFTDRPIGKREVVIDYKRCIYLKGLSVLRRKVK